MLGKGALTKHIIAQEPKSLFLIEKDKSLKPYLEKLIHEKEQQSKIIYDDVLKVNFIRNYARQKINHYWKLTI